MSSTTDLPSTCRFLDLPKELREMIYENLVPQSSGFALGTVFTFGVRPMHKKSPALRTLYSISQTCRQIREEALFTYYSSTPLIFDFLWHKDVESARRWLACQSEVAISSMRDVAFRHGSLDHEHHALINVSLRKGVLSIQGEAFESCSKGKMVQSVVRRLQTIVDDLCIVEGKKTLTRKDLGRMFDAVAMMFGVQWSEGSPVTLCETLY